MSKGRVLPEPGSWPWLGFGSTQDGISWVTREASLRDKPESGPHVTSGPQQNEHAGLSLTTLLTSVHSDRGQGSDPVITVSPKLGNLLLAGSVVTGERGKQERWFPPVSMGGPS